MRYLPPSGRYPGKNGHDGRYHDAWAVDYWSLEPPGRKMNMSPMASLSIRWENGSTAWKKPVRYFSDSGYSPKRAVPASVFSSPTPRCFRSPCNNHTQSCSSVAGGETHAAYCGAVCRSLERVGRARDFAAQRPHSGGALCRSGTRSGRDHAFRQYALAYHGEEARTGSAWCTASCGCLAAVKPTPATRY